MRASANPAESRLVKHAMQTAWLGPSLPSEISGFIAELASTTVKILDTCRMVYGVSPMASPGIKGYARGRLARAFGQQSTDWYIVQDRLSEPSAGEQGDCLARQITWRKFVATV